MKRNWVAGLLITAVSIAAIVFIIKGNLYVSVLFMTALFALTNGFRAVSFKEKGFERESKWMKGMSIFFSIAFFIILAVIIF
ncbi:hypothetical protein M9R32_06015 [Paenisporosarcina quisquiliarum]|jgi:hypothetical protein|uniref:Aspartyl/asparaginyl-tRNA synthetase n=1 Tax=Paenisporosarcina quisquiliarum TaxID=365346 RepID=A0A9X3RCG3_9BACL|nr:hypothetical protein [Paenisporosarcina quisquiliarum]MCZ8536730.1 hypothetical protein [Paenisporosarcina quisquiliarum]